jgi:hypothetical protein
MVTKKELDERYNQLHNDIERYIYDKMNDNNVALISFVRNGDDVEFSVDRAYIDGDEGREVVAVAVIKKCDRVILFNDIPSNEELEEIFDTPIHYKSDHLDALLDNALEGYDNSMLIDDLYCPLDTLFMVMHSVTETLEEIKTLENYGK